MDAGALARILLARAVEEAAPETLSPDAVLEATVAAGAASDPAGWFARRAEVLLGKLPEPFRAPLAMPRLLARGGLLLFVVAAALGLATNYLGPARRIHVITNPIALLILWNLAVLLLLLLGRLRRPSPVGFAWPRSRGSGPSTDATLDAPRSGLLTRWLLRRAVPALWMRFQAAAADGRAQARQVGRVARRFWALWTEAARPLFAVASRRMASLAALGLAVGAVAGMFVRGLFLDYQIVWRSTFLTDPESVGLLLRGLFALPALLLGQPVPDAASAAALMRPEGVPAADWIWRYAVAAGLFIALPRSLMILAASRRLRSLEAGLDPALQDAYYREVMQRARAQRVEEIQAAIQTDVRVESRKFAAGIATYVCETLYDGRIAPRLHAFREHGGRIEQLEQEIAALCEGFQGQLDATFSRAQAEFERSLAGAVARTIEADVSFRTPRASGLQDEVRGTSRDAAEGVGGSIGRGLNRVVGSAVSGAIAVLAGTLSGGFGKSFGAAVMVALLGTSGPLGFVIGALAGLVAAGGAYFLGRERAAGALRSLPLPAALVRTLFSRGRLERLVRDGRTRCHEAVEQLILQRLEPLTPEIASQIWTQVKPALAEGRRGTPAAG